MREFLRQLRWTGVATLIALVGATSPAPAQNPYAVARVVNQSIITNYEVSQRQRLMRALGAGQVTRDVVLRSLTEDRIRMQAAANLGISMTDEARADGLEQFAEQRQMSVGGLRSRTQSAGVAADSLNAFIDPQIIWRNVVQLRFRDRATPSESDLQNALTAAANRAQESVFLREIAIPFAERGIAGARSLAERIRRDVANGASFPALARRYSRTSSAPRGGSIGWRQVNRLPGPLSSELLALLPGDVTEPIEVPAGIILLQLVNVREDPGSARRDVSASWVELVVPGPTETAIAAATPLSSGIQSCNDAIRRAGSAGDGSGLKGPTPLPEIPSDIGLILAGLDAGEAAVASFGDSGTRVFYLCSRAVDADPEQVETLRSSLFNRRMTNFASGYLAELMSDAVITDR